MKNSQLSKALQVLGQYKPNISPDDKKAAREKLMVSSYTISQYLNGNGKNIGTAERMIMFFREIILKREKLLTGSEAIGHD